MHLILTVWLYRLNYDVNRRVKPLVACGVFVMISL